MLVSLVDVVAVAAVVLIVVSVAVVADMVVVEDIVVYQMQICMPIILVPTSKWVRQPTWHKHTSPNTRIPQALDLARCLNLASKSWFAT
jgi:hypothetical protein